MGCSAVTTTYVASGSCAVVSYASRVVYSVGTCMASDSNGAANYKITACTSTAITKTTYAAGATSGVCGTTGTPNATFFVPVACASGTADTILSLSSQSQ